MLLEAKFLRIRIKGLNRACVRPVLTEKMERQDVGG